MEPTMDEKLKACIALCEEGDPKMCAFLGKEFYYGLNIPQDLDRALRYLTVAAADGDAVSQFTLGFMYWSGRGTEPDIDKAYDLSLIRQRNKKFRKRCTTLPRSCSQRILKRTKMRQ